MIVVVVIDHTRQTRRLVLCSISIRNFRPPPLTPRERTGLPFPAQSWTVMPPKRAPCLPAPTAEDLAAAKALLQRGDDGGKIPRPTATALESKTEQRNNYMKEYLRTKSQMESSSS